MRILVTGASGFAGGHLLAELCRTGGNEITAGVFEDRTVPLVSCPGDTSIEWVSLDITSSDSIGAAIRASAPDQVYHLAGQASVGESFRAAEVTWNLNATGTLRLLQCLTDEGYSASRVLIVSSAEVYGAVPSEEQPITEDQAVRPVSPYGASKAAAELVAMQYARTGGVGLVTARSFNHIGPGQDERFVLPSFARQLARVRRGEAEPVLRVGNLEVRRDFLDVRDVVRAYVILMDRAENGGVYNVASGRMTSLEDVVRRLVHLSGTNAEILVDPERVRAVDIPALVGDTSRLRALGWEPATDLDDTLADLLRWADEREAAGG